MQANNKKSAWDRSDASRRGSKSRSGPRRKGRKANKGRVAIYGAAASQLWSDVKLLKSLINTECHYLDVTGSAIAVGATPTFSLLNGCAVGDTAVTRTGQSIKLDRLDFRFNITGDSTAVRQFLRVVIVMDHQCNGAIFTSSKLLNDDTSPLNIVSPYTDGSQLRFKPIFDETYAISTSGQGVVDKALTFSVKDHVMYNTNTAGDVTDIISNSLYLIYFSDQTVNKPVFSYYSRLWFIDN